MEWMVLGALGCINNADFENRLVNDNIVLDVFIMYTIKYLFSAKT